MSNARDYPQTTMAESYLKAAKETLVETFWPTRCALCDHPGTLLCSNCRINLPYIDYWHRCELCGASFGSIQCSECNPVTLKDLGMKKPPYSGCVSVIRFETAGARLITTYKDKNEQGLAPLLASMICDVIPTAWLHQRIDMKVSFIPSSARAYKRRGFDHAERLAQEVSQKMGLPFTRVFERPKSKDQRSLTRLERIANMERRFQVKEGPMPVTVLLVDDVYTTGASLSFAAKKLAEVGIRTVYCTTFARVW